MKKSNKIIAAAMSAIMLTTVGATGASAATTGEALTFDPVNGAVTVITDKSGKQTTYDGVLDASTMERSAAIESVASYELLYNKKSVLTVTLTDMQSSSAVAASSSKTLNGYCAVEFDGLEGNQSAFITGLSPSNVQEVQDELLKCCAENTTMELEALDFIDAEKQGIEDKDLYQCWAASCSNILTYTGWAKEAGFEDEDDMFDTFSESFDDYGSAFEYGMAWFFNGVSGYVEEAADYYAEPKPGTGGFFKDYAYDKMYTSTSFGITTDGIDAMRQLKQELRGGSGILLGVSIYSDEGFPGGHALSCWGYVEDNDYPDTDKAHYTRLLISDSDSDYTGSKDRRTAPNIMSSVSLEPYDYEEETDYGVEIMDTWKLPDYGENVALSSFTSLLPYSEDVEKETSLKATRNKSTTVDFAADDFYLGQYEDSNYEIRKVPSDADIYIGGMWSNYSDKDYEKNLTVRLSVTDSNGRQVFTKDVTVETYSYAYSNDQTEYVNIGRLPEGDYTFTEVVNCDKKVREAYYYNNTYSAAFQVVKPVLDASKLTVTATDPKPYRDSVVYDLNINGLTEEQRAQITGCDLYSRQQSVTGDEDSGYMWMDVDIPYENNDELIPSRILLDNRETTMVMVKLMFKDMPPVYVFTQELTVDQPEIARTCTIDDDLMYEESFTSVDENAKGFANGESFDCTLENVSSQTVGTVSGTYALVARNSHKWDDAITLSGPVDFTLKPGEELSVHITDFDVPLPKGEYLLDIELEGDFVVSETDFFPSMYLKAGDIEDPDYYPGDVNRDGVVNINDATYLQKALAGYFKLDPIHELLADVDFNGKVNINDVTTIQKIINE
ncbi:MAG: dockerin type I repeat-containing protein [Ruminococcus sp.]|nr:dockerin type I repeat-containing protein [Ruminococcus sp.]